MRETISEEGSADGVKEIIDEGNLSMERPFSKGLIASASNGGRDGWGPWLLLCGHRVLLVLQFLDRHYQHFNLSGEDSELVLLGQWQQRWWS